jgi:hypothetical protein
MAQEAIIGDMFVGEINIPTKIIGRIYLIVKKFIVEGRAICKAPIIGLTKIFMLGECLLAFIIVHD